MSGESDLDKIFELTPELLEQVSGGVVTERAETVLNALIFALKKDTAAEHTPEEAIEFVTSKLMDNVNLEGVTKQEVADYIRANWG